MKNLLLFILFLLPFTSFAQQREANTYRIMSYNVRNGNGLDGRTDYDRIAGIIEKACPDVIALQELDSVTTRGKQTDVLKKLADITRMHYIYAPAISYQGGKYGIGLLSKERPLLWKNVPLPGREEARTLLIVEFDKYLVFATHFSLNKDDRQTSVNIINEYAGQYNKPIFLAGDLNDDPESEAIKNLSRNWKILNNDKTPTFPANEPKQTIDYIAGYISNGKTYSVHSRQVMNEPVASDHRPLFVDVRLKADVDKVMRTKPYLQNPSTDAMTVMWMTNVPCRSWIEYGTDSTDMKRARTFVEGEAMANNTTNRIRIEGLQPGTKYYYRAVSQEITLYQPYHKEFGDTISTPVYSFTTWDDNKKDFTALIFNDIHDNYSLFDKLYTQVKDSGYDVVFFNGDCIADVQTEFNAVRSISHYCEGVGGYSIPTIFIRGNHETRGGYSMFLWNLLEKKGNSHSYGAFNLGDTRFVLLDCGEDKPDDHWVYYDMNDFTHYREDQARFLESEIKSDEFKNATKRVLIHHIPIYGKHLDDYHPCKDIWEPILSKAKFNISLNAHTHRFEYIPIGEDKNVYPVIIGGGNNEKSVTVSVLQKKGKRMTLKVLNVQGEILQNLDL
ncbi:MAG: metallophosphoesterase [Prevotella sp.]|jgi:endonuclease/exonuclease/phosphatase family metal-dependent hydrolase/Icc-related predicted phosphoesterase|nr:metallophosphoesterase [Prevotella sp.]